MKLAGRIRSPLQVHVCIDRNLNLVRRPLRQPPLSRLHESQATDAQTGFWKQSDEHTHSDAE